MGKTALKSVRDEKLKQELMGNDINVLHEVTSVNLFESLDIEGKGSIVKKDIFEALESRGILMTDPRIQETVKDLEAFKDTEEITAKQFYKIVVQNITLIEKALKGDLIIPDFSKFAQHIAGVFEETRSNMSGHVADYIPQLARVNPNY
ncbi:hypothetical protein OAJ27_01035, partial [bacterium]|nr:hypothetical protein [bacterium]